MFHFICAQTEKLGPAGRAPSNNSFFPGFPCSPHLDRNLWVFSPSGFVSSVAICRLYNRYLITSLSYVQNGFPLKFLSQSFSLRRWDSWPNFPRCLWGIVCSARRVIQACLKLTERSPVIPGGLKTPQPLTWRLGTRSCASAVCVRVFGSPAAWGCRKPPGSVLYRLCFHGVLLHSLGAPGFGGAEPKGFLLCKLKPREQGFA